MDSREYRAMSALEGSHWWYTSLHAIVRDLLGTPGGSVLDAGCGTGGMLRLLGSRSSIGIDISRDALGYARMKTSAPLACASVSMLPFRSGCFDAVLSLDVLYHRNVSDDTDGVREMVRVLKPGGMLMLNLPAYESLRGPHDVAIHSARRYTSQDIRQILADTGLRVEFLTYRLCLLFPFACLTRIGRRFRTSTSPKHPERSDLRPIHPFMNRILCGIMHAEDLLTRCLGPMPFGLSVFCVARKPAELPA